MSVSCWPTLLGLAEGSQVLIPHEEDIPIVICFFSTELSARGPSLKGTGTVAASSFALEWF